MCINNSHNCLEVIIIISYVKQYYCVQRETLTLALNNPSRGEMP